jgi:hypothetical protein
MKKLLSITLILFIIFNYIETKKTEKLEKRNKKSLRTVSKKANSKSKSKGDMASNSLGLVLVDKNIRTIIDKAPYELERCDQIVAMNAEYIPNVDDFTKRAQGFFTLTAYHLNRFENHDAASLERAILWADQRIPPSEPQGAENCLLIDGGIYEKPLMVCFKTRDEFNVFKDLIGLFEDCRSGKMVGNGSLAHNEAAGGKGAKGSGDVAKACGFDGPMGNPDDMIAELEGKEKQVKEEVNGTDEGFWTPGSALVPGAPIEEVKAKKPFGPKY